MNGAFRRVGKIAAVVVSAHGLVWSMSCSLMPSRRHAEPSYVVIVNNSGRIIHNVAVRESPDDVEQPARLASVSPLMAGREYSVKRRPDSRPLSANAIVAWEWDRGVEQSVRVSIRDVIGKATGAPNEALVIRILPYGDAVLSVETLNERP